MQTMFNQLKTVLLLSGLSALLVAFGAAFGSGAMYVALVLAVAMNFGAYFFSDKIVLKMQRAVEVSPHEEPRLHAMVEDLAQRANIPKPAIYIIPDAQPNAFATGRNPQHAAVAVTEGILRVLDERELRGVLAHEIAHVNNRDILIASIAAMIATSVTYLANIAQFGMIFGGGRDDEDGSPLATLLMIFLAPLAATLIQLGISRSREFIADETGARLTGDPKALASALHKLSLGAERIPAHVAPATASLFIVNPLASRAALKSLFSTHPPMEERIARLQAMNSRVAGAA